MFTITVWIVGLIGASLALNILLPLAKNVQLARRSGLPFVVVPFHAYNTLVAMFMNRTVLRILEKLLPNPSITSWRRLVMSGWPWRLRYAPFASLGTDTFLTVAPGGCILHTADADVISQITSRGDDFPKATALYKHINIYGTNVVSSGGATWRRHRAVTAPSFSEKNNRLVWRETMEVTEAILASWLGPDGSSKTVSSLASDTMRLSLEVIGRAGLGEKMDWSKTVGQGETNMEDLPTGHKMTFTAALRSLLVNIFWIIAVPKWLLSKFTALCTIGGDTDI
jgi:hypothetical protein